MMGALKLCPNYAYHSTYRCLLCLFRTLDLLLRSNIYLLYILIANLVLNHETLRVLREL